MEGTPRESAGTWGFLAPIRKFNAVHYTYVLESGKDGHWYTGVTGDLKARLRSHLKGQVRSTHYKLPVRLIYYEACIGEADSRRRERYLKSGNGKLYLRQRLASFFRIGVRG